MISPYISFFALALGLYMGWQVQEWRYTAEIADAYEEVRKIEQGRDEVVSGLVKQWEEDQREFSAVQTKLASDVAKYRRINRDHCPVPADWRMLHNRAAMPKVDSSPR